MTGDYPPTPEFPIGSIERSYADGYAAAQHEIERLRMALENARRDIFSIAPKRGSRSPLRKVAEEAAMNIAIALGVNR